MRTHSDAHTAHAKFRFPYSVQNYSNRLDYWLEFLERAASEGDKYLQWALPDTFSSMVGEKPMPRALFERLGPKTKQLLFQAGISIEMKSVGSC